MRIEIHRYEQFYTVKHRERNVIGDTVTEFKTFSEMEEFVGCLLQISRRQLLEEVIITREAYDREMEYYMAKSKANEIIPTLNDDGKPYSDAPSNPDDFPF
jgi:hypothetical protein